MARSGFSGFPVEGIEFFGKLMRNNRREWFQPRKEIFEAQLKQPMRELVEALNGELRKLAPEYVTDPEKAIYRIYRDTRFSNNKLPYKTHVAAWWSHMGMQKTSGAGYYFQVSPKGVVIAAGAYMPEKEQLAAIRNWLLNNHVQFRRLLQKPAVRRTFTEFEGEALTRPPKGFPCDHPAMDLIKCKQWGLSTTLPAATALEKNLAQTLIRHFKLLAPLVDALNTPIAASLVPRKKVLFGLR